MIVTRIVGRLCKQQFLFKPTSTLAGQFSLVRSFADMKDEKSWSSSHKEDDKKKMDTDREQHAKEKVKEATKDLNKDMKDRVEKSAEQAMGKVNHAKDKVASKGAEMNDKSSNMGKESKSRLDTSVVDATDRSEDHTQKSKDSAVRKSSPKVEKRDWEQKEDGISAKGRQTSGSWGDNSHGGDWAKNKGDYEGVDASGNKIKGAFKAQEQHEKIVDKHGKVKAQAYSYSSTDSSTITRDFNK